jgi:hypothetical protein
MAAPQEPAKTPPDPEQPAHRKHRVWAIAACVIVLILAAAGLGTVALLRSNSVSSMTPVKANNVSTNANTNGNSNTNSNGNSNGQATVIPVSPPFTQGGQQQQRVKIIINGSTTIGTRFFSSNGWYIPTGPSTYIGTVPPSSASGSSCHVQHPLPGCGSAQGQPPAASGSSGSSGSSPKMCAGRPCSATAPNSGSSGASGSSGSSAGGSSGSSSSGSSYLSLSALEQSMSTAQTQALAGAPSSDFNYTGTGSVTVQVTCIQAGAGPAVHTYSCWATDGAGDKGESDTVTVTGTSWTDTGMTWTGPNVPSGSYTTPAETGSGTTS